MYPWACAVNTKSQILVTDSRNHRIQMFSPDGHFISRFSFDGLNHSRYLKGLTTPRGVAFTPQGNIIISDFENHRLILIDSSMTKVKSSEIVEIYMFLIEFSILDSGYAWARRIGITRVLSSFRNLLWRWRANNNRRFKESKSSDLLTNARILMERRNSPFVSQHFDI